MIKMDVRHFLVSFLAIASILLFVGTVSAYTVTGDLADVTDIEVDGISALGSNDISVIAGEKASVRVYFTSDVDTSDVRLRIELEGEKEDVEATTTYFDVEEDKKYSKAVSIKIPYELRDKLSEDMTMTVKIWNGDYKTEIEDIELRVQRPSYNSAIKYVGTSQDINAGDYIPVDVVLRNIGYNDLDDLYVTAKISALNIEKQVYFGDLVSLDACDCKDDEICEERCADCIDEDDEETVSGRLYLSIPENAQTGTYSLEVEVSNSDMTVNKITQIEITNDIPTTVIKTSSGLLVVNPTSELKVYRIVSPEGENVVSVYAGSSKSVEVEADTDNYAVSVLTLTGEVVDTFVFSQNEDEMPSSVVALTIVLILVFLVLLVVLIVLLGKKPEEKEEFGESYY